LLGKKFKPKTGDIKPVWTVVLNIDSVHTNVHNQRTRFSSLKDKCVDPVSLFWELWPGDVDEQLSKLNNIAEEANWKKRQFRNGSEPPKWKPVSKQEFETFISLFCAAANLEQKGYHLFEKDVSTQQLVFSCPSRFDRFMSLKRFKEIRSKAVYLFADLEARRKNDQWWPHLQKVPRKPKQLRTELKNLACCETGVILAIDIQKGKRHTTEDKFAKKYGSTAGVSCRLIDMMMNHEQLPPRRV